MATRMGSGRASHEQGEVAARQAVRRALEIMGEGEVKLAIAFISPQVDAQAALATIREEIGDAELVGCSSSAEFTEQGSGVGSVAVTTIASDNLEVRVGVGEGFASDIEGSVERAIAGFRNAGRNPLGTRWQGRTLFLLVDGLAGRAEQVIDELMLQTGMQYQLFGGAAADQAQFQKTQVFHNGRVLGGAFVCVELLSERPWRIAFQHGWTPVGRTWRVTRSEGGRLIELNGRPAWEVYQEHAAEQGIAIVEGSENAYLMENILGVQVPGGHKLRVPLFLHEDGSITCAAEVPEGALVQMMRGDDTRVEQGGSGAVQEARGGLGRDEVAGAIAFECVATQLRLGDRFSDQVQATAAELDPGTLLGCASFGQLARIQGGFSGLMDATSLVCLVAA